MSRYQSYLNSAVTILKLYNGQEPFAGFLKKYFAANKKFGSRDRKQVSNLCYCFFRFGKAVMNVSFEEKILSGLFLCSSQPNEILAALKPEWYDKAGLSISEKLLIVNYSLFVNNIFPWKDKLSEGTDHEKFCASFFVQPDLFLRIRPGMKETVQGKLITARCDFSFVTDDCIVLPNSTKIETVIELDKEAVVQDYSSQQAGEFIKSAIVNTKSKISLWDCCAGSGGKSIMAYDLNPEIELAVSDSRETILFNLKKRFEKAGIKKYKSALIDLVKNENIQHTIIYNQQSIIIADVPCTGSGTWSRTPEQLYFFDEEEIETYTALQKKILTNVMPCLQPGGFLVYITCSVFKKENEDNVEFVKDNFGMQLVRSALLNGYDKKADSMFVAVLKKPE